MNMYLALTRAEWGEDEKVIGIFADYDSALASVQCDLKGDLDETRRGIISEFSTETALTGIVRNADFCGAGDPVQNGITRTFYVFMDKPVEIRVNPYYEYVKGSAD